MYFFNSYILSSATASLYYRESKIFTQVEQNVSNLSFLIFMNESLLFFFTDNCDFNEARITLLLKAVLNENSGTVVVFQL